MTIRNDASRTRIATKDKRRPRAVVARQGQVLLDTDVDQQSRHHLERLEIETFDSLGSPGRLLVPAGNNGFKITPDGALANFNIGQGRGYLDGWLLENPSVCKLTTQPHPRTGDSVTTPAVIALKSLIRHVDPVEDPVLADVALGDAQASGRSLVDWQVFPTPITSGGTITCATILTNFSWLALIAPSSGTLTLIEQPASASTDPCSLTPGGGYTRLENLLYRFEVHGGDVGTNMPDGPRFNLHNLKIKFSRRNASVMARIKAISNTEITVAPPSLDPRNWFAPGMYAEIVSIHDDVDPRAALANERLFPVAQASDDRVTLQATAGQIAATGATGDGTWFLRLWEAFPEGNGIAIVSAPGGASTSAEIDLGDGLKIKLSTGTTLVGFRRGDYWNVAARADGTTDWPKTGGVPDAMTPHGPAVRYAPLAVATAGTTSPFEDCRIPFATLSDRSLLYRGGDGQSVFAPAGSGMIALPAKARVAVMRGETPVLGATVRWSYLGPSGGACLINGALCQAGTPVDTLTTAGGLAEVTWSIDPSKAADTHQIQAAIATGPTTTIDPPLVFSAVFETAEHTSYKPGACSHLTGVDNVQEALDVLCSKIGGDDKPALTLTSITLLDAKGVATDLIQKETLILNALEVRFNSFVSGIAFGIDGGVPDIKIQDFDPVVEVELDLPYPTTDMDRVYWLQASGSQIPSFFGFQRVRLDGTVNLMPKPPAGSKPGLIWKPSKMAAQFIESAGRHLWGQQINQDAAARLKELGWQFATPFGRILCRIRLRSALIWVGNEKQRIYLNAEHLGIAAGVTDRELLVKDRDPQRAGDLDIFIYLSNEAIKVTRPTGAVGKTGRLGRGAVDKKSLAPFHPTPQSLVVEMLKLGKLKRGERMVDVGSGDGRIVITAARDFGADATGFEFDKELWQKTGREIKRLKLQKHARNVLGDATAQDISRADLVTLYLVPEGNERIRPMLEKQLKPGARVVSHEYEMPGWSPERTERVAGEDGRSHTLFAYTR